MLDPASPVRPGLRSRRALAVLGVSATVAGSVVVLAQPSSGATLSELGKAAGIAIGAAVPANLLNDSQYTSIVKSEFSSITPENEMKWDATEPQPGSFSWSGGDAIASFAKANGKRLRGHTLVWHQQLPGWVSGLGSASQVETAMVNHISGVAGHYKGQVAQWDVVNEIFNENGTYRSSPFYDKLGTGFVATAFKAARAADSGAKLCINDYNIESINSKSNAVYDLVRTLKSQNVPIDCVGFQSHFVGGGVPGDLQSNLSRFAALGVTVEITELDIRVPTPASSSSLQTQADDYAKAAKACRAVKACTGITIWGVYDGRSWIPDVFPGTGAALLYDTNYQKKPAYTSFAAALSDGPLPSDSTTKTTKQPPQDGVVLSSTFEDGTTGGWAARASEKLSVVSSTAHGGARALSVTGRTAEWNGPQYDVLDIMRSGSTYTVSAWVRLASGESATTANISVERRTSGTASYDNIVSGAAVTANGWTKLSGTYKVPSGIDYITVYVELASTTASFLVDDVTISTGDGPVDTTKPPAGKNALATTFEKGNDTQGWKGKGNQTLAVVSGVSAGGSHSLKVSASQPVKAGPVNRIPAGKLTSGSWYKITGSVRVGDGESAAGFTIGAPSGDAWAGHAKGTKWAKVVGSFKYSGSGAVALTVKYKKVCTGDAAPKTFYLDNVKVVAVSGPVSAPAEPTCR